MKKRIFPGRFSPKGSLRDKEQLNSLLEEEVLFRQERAIKMRLKLAKFPVLKTIDNFDFAFQPEIDKDAVMALFSLRFVEEKANVILVGPSGDRNIYFCRFTDEALSREGKCVDVMGG